jgi:hypothetical protein
MCWRRMLCFFVHSQWEKNLKSIPFKVVLSWKQCSCDVITRKVYYENLRKIPQFVNNYKRFLKNLRKTPWCTKNQAYFLIPSCLTKTVSWLQDPLVCHIIFFKYPIFLCIFPKEKIKFQSGSYLTYDLILILSLSTHTILFY